MGRPNEPSGSRQRRGTHTDVERDKGVPQDDLRAVVASLLDGSPGAEIDPDRLFELMAEALGQTATILDEMVESNTAWLAEVEARRKRIDWQIEENWRGLDRLRPGGDP